MKLNDAALKNFSGEIVTKDRNTIISYSTDASAYKQTPMAVAYPKTDADILLLIEHANKTNIPLIPRGAGTSLAGQVVGGGIIVDVSRYMNSIFEVNAEQHWVRLQPGVVRDKLNLYLKDFNLFFGPETSTANRCTIGGMVGNNACGAHSLIYGSTRDHLLEVKGYLSDGTFVHFKPLSKDEFNQKLQLQNLEGKIYRTIYEILSNDADRQEIINQYPDSSLQRRNVGYAIDQLIYNEIFSNQNQPFNFCKLLAGSEGTLMFITEIKLNLVPLENKILGVLCAHFANLDEAIKANIIALQYHPDAIELIDDIIINRTKNNIEQQRNRFFIQGDPGAILLIELSADTKDEVLKKSHQLTENLKKENLGYHYPVFFAPDISRIWALRKAALGLLTNIPGDAKPVSLVEDNAVPVQNLGNYITEFKQLLSQHGLDCVFHAHISTGELHTRPVINLKTREGQILFRQIGYETACLVKKYRGSISGEHGDGRLRSEFIPIIIGEKNYNLCKKVKYCWDEKNIFNPGKIVDPVKMDESLRYIPDMTVPDFKTRFDFSDSLGFIRHIEQCNGSGDCIKQAEMGGVMCPSYMASRDEKMSTRARANVLRENFYSLKQKAFHSREIIEILDSCLSCKGCKSECPSNIDMTKLKAEFYQQYYNNKPIPLRSKLFANLPVIYKIGSCNSLIFNNLLNLKFTEIILKTIGITQNHKIPRLAKTSFIKWYKKENHKFDNSNCQQVWLYIDEFTNYLEPELGIKAYLILNKLGFAVNIIPFTTSGRTYLSKGLVKRSKKIIEKNLSILKNIWKGEPIIGIEPSALLTFRDENIDLSEGETKEFARSVAKQSFLFEEFMAREKSKNPSIGDYFGKEHKKIYVHAHCYQKSLTDVKTIKEALKLPENYEVEILNTGCCGMAGSFGYEVEHYELSLKIGELNLFPAVRKLKNEIIVAAGTSCRQQIMDVINVKTFHPLEILYNALL
jgi:FAD/FMN-containing dehydrogenase/Fe-S oxidoreductase